MKPHKLITIGLILLLVACFALPADARVMRTDVDFDFSRMPENIQQLKQALENIEELTLRITFNCELMNSPEELAFVLQKMRKFNLTPEFILKVHRIIKGVEANVSYKLNTPIRTDLILIRPKGHDAGADLVTVDEKVEISWLGLNERMFEDKKYISIISIDLDGLFEAYEIVRSDYVDSLKALVAHELGHNLSEFPTRANGDLVYLIQEGFDSRYVGVVQFNFIPYREDLSLEDIVGRLHEIIADKIALQLTDISSMIAKEKMEGAKHGVKYDVLRTYDMELNDNINIVYDAWRVAKARFLDLDDIANEIKSRFERLAMGPKQVDTFRQLISERYLPALVP